MKSEPLLSVNWNFCWAREVSTACRCDRPRVLFLLLVAIHSQPSQTRWYHSQVRMSKSSPHQPVRPVSACPCATHMCRPTDHLLFSIRTKRLHTLQISHSFACTKPRNTEGSTMSDSDGSCLYLSVINNDSMAFTCTTVNLFQCVCNQWNVEYDCNGFQWCKVPNAWRRAINRRWSHKSNGMGCWPHEKRKTECMSKEPF